MRDGMSSAGFVAMITRWLARGARQTAFPAGSLMAGHSSWASIQRRNSALAARRDRARVRPPGAGQEMVRYEGYGPGGAAVLVECLTDDRGRIGAQVRNA